MTLPEDGPLVSCVMPTANRRPFVARAVRYFLVQDYAHRELVILDDGADCVADLAQGSPRIRFIRLSGRRTLGAKRNAAVEASRGDLIMHWDDDDWMAPRRISLQVDALLRAQAEACGARQQVYLELATGQAWLYEYPAHLPRWLIGNTLLYTRDFWRRSPFPHLDVGEDSRFVLNHRLEHSVVLADYTSYVGLIHPGNTCPKATHGAYWSRWPGDLHRIMGDDLSWYRAQAEASGARWAAAPRPLVSCIMPTSNRRRFVPLALRYFLRQDYPNTELIVLDDGTDSVADLMPDDSRVRYERIAAGRTLGAKRNACIELARGDLIMHWDDDDWMAADRISRQVNALHLAHAEICGLRRLLLYDLATGQSALYEHPATMPGWLVGGTLLYTREFWRRAPFADVNVGEDTAFLSSRPLDHVAVPIDYRFYVAMSHSSNTYSKHPGGPYWSASQDDIRSILGADLAFYHEPAAKLQPPPDRSVAMLTVAREADLSLPEFAAFNHGRSLPWMRRWEQPFALFQMRLSNTMSVLDCTINPVTFQERLARLYPHVLYRYWNPIQNGQFAIPFGLPDGAFDRVLCINTLEHLLQPQRVQLIAALAKKLKPDGWLVLTSDSYFESSWEQPAFLQAGVMRSDRAEIFNGWNKVTMQDWFALCEPHGLKPMAEPPPDPCEGDPTLYRNPPPFAHACIAGVFACQPDVTPPGRKVVLGMLTWNTRDVSVDSVRAYIREAQMLRRLGHEPLLCICDNGSNDGTAEALRALEVEMSSLGLAHRVILNPTNRGSSIARNQIIDHLHECNADYLLFMDGDIEVVPFSSFAMLRYMENCGHALGCIGADSASQTPLRERASPLLYSIDEPLETTNLVAWTQYGMFRRAIFDEGIRFEESAPFDGPGWGFEDNDLAFQMAMHGYLNQRFFGMTYLHRDVHSSVRIMRQQGIDAAAIYARRKQYVIGKWEHIAAIEAGPLQILRRVNM
jgi:glycosyltransferase involved in cell wall biosynthesis